MFEKSFWIVAALVGVYSLFLPSDPNTVYAFIGTAAAIGAALSPILGGIVGNIASSGDRAKAQAAMEEALRAIEEVGAPPDLAREIILEKFKSAGVLTPQMEQDISLGVSQVSQVQEDPALREAQMSALDLLKSRSESGLNASDRLRLNQIRNQVARDNEATQNDIIRDMNARGIAGSGAELALRMKASQSSANRASEEADRVAAMSNEAALAALNQLGTLSGQVRGQDFDIARNKASAADEFNRFNVQNQMAVQQRNVDRNNQSAQFNLQNNQQLSNANTQAANQELQRQREAEAQKYNLERQRAADKAAALTGSAQNSTNNAQQTSQMWSSIGSGVGAGVAGIGQNANNQAKLDLEKAKFIEKYGYDPLGKK